MSLLVFWTGLMALSQGAGAQTPPPSVDVYTIGPGDDIFAHFGHSAMCVTDAASPKGRCYNWGTANFDTPVPLTYEFVRGRAKFWVSVIDLPRMVEWYEEEDRTIWRQTLPLTSTEAAALAQTLNAATAEAVKYYRYHHFLDNCTTRIRDLTDGVEGGALRKLSEGSPPGPSYREFARRGFRGHPALLVVANLALGRAADHPTTTWEAMFLPEVLRDAIEKGAGEKPEVLYLRRGPPVEGAIWTGDALIAGTGILLALMILLASWTGRRRLVRAMLTLTGFLLGSAGLFLWTLALASAFSELIYNEVLLLLVPTDIALPFLGPRFRARYIRVRLAVIAIAGLLDVTGIFVQPLLPATVLTALPLAATFLMNALPSPTPREEAPR
jgi:hypothetical protein